MIIYGHGQGGILAAGLWYAHNTDLKIKGLILDRAPLNGVYCFGNGALIKQYGDKIPISHILKRYFSYHSKLGVQDLAPIAYSAFLQKVYTGLVEIPIPCILLCIRVSDDEAMKDLFNTSYDDVKLAFGTHKKLYQLLCEKVSGTKTEHDGFVAVDSQLLSKFGSDK